MDGWMDGWIIFFITFILYSFWGTEVEGVGRVSEAGAGEVGVCEATAVTPWSLLLEPLGFFIGTKNPCNAFTRKSYDFLTLFIACETVSVCFSVTVTEAARFVSVNHTVAFSQSKYCNFTGVKFYWCFVIGRGILQPLLELLNTEPASDCF